MAIFLIFSYKLTVSEKRKFNFKEGYKSANYIYKEHGLSALLSAVSLEFKDVITDDNDVYILSDSHDNLHSLVEIENNHVYEKCKNSVVNIYAYKSNINIQTGSGVVFSDKRYVVTNYHVISGSDRYVVKNFDGTNTYRGELVCFDESEDLAIIRLVNPDNLVPVEFYRGEDCKVGDRVISLSFIDDGSLFLSSGFIGSITRPLRDWMGNLLSGMIITDCNIMKGSSGGALLSTTGKLIGLNYSVYTDESGNSISCSYESSRLMRILNRMLALSSNSHSFLSLKGGIDIACVSMTEDVKNLSLIMVNGVMVTATSPGSDAEKILKVGNTKVRYKENDIYLGGDVITKLNSYEIFGIDDIYTALSDTVAGDIVDIEYYRDGNYYKSKITLTARDVNYNLRFMR